MKNRKGMNRVDKDGITYLEALKHAGLEGGYFSQINPDLLGQAQLRKDELKAFVEVQLSRAILSMAVTFSHSR